MRNLVVSVIAILLATAVIVDGQSPNIDSSKTYIQPNEFIVVDRASCKSQCENTFRSCVNNSPEALWPACKERYFGCLSSC